MSSNAICFALVKKLRRIAVNGNIIIKLLYGKSFEYTNLFTSENKIYGSYKQTKPDRTKKTQKLLEHRIDIGRRLSRFELHVRKISISSLDVMLTVVTVSISYQLCGLS